MAFGMQPNVHYTIKRTKPIEITFHATGQTMVLHSADRPELIVGTNIGGFLITEAGQIKREVFENCVARARDKKAERTIGILEGTPEGDGWFMDDFDFLGQHPEHPWRRFLLHTDDNIANLREGYIEALCRVHSPTKLKSYRFGEFASFRTGDVFDRYFESS